jgi:hypothetical protein
MDNVLSKFISKNPTKEMIHKLQLELIKELQKYIDEK